MKIWKLNIELIHLLTINVFHMFLKYDKESASLAVLNYWEDQDCLEPIFRCKNKNNKKIGFCLYFFLFSKGLVSILFKTFFKNFLGSI